MNGLRNGREVLMDNEKYIEKKINSLSVYNVYWCMYELRLRGQLPTEIILKDDSSCKLRLIRILKKKRYDPKSLNIFLEVSAENSIPLSYVKWFYEDKRAALWLNMVLKQYGLPSNLVSIESDIDVFVHDVIFNRRVLIQNKNIVERDSDAQIALKKETLDLLKDAYLLSKLQSKDIKWLTSKSNSSVKISYTYQYMNKMHDLDNLRQNKEQKKRYRDWNKNANKLGHRQALICTDAIKFKATDTAMRLCHMIASLDYWMFDNYWLYQESNLVNAEKADNRRLFISNMYDAWNAKQKRDRDKNKKEQGINLTNDNKKNLKYLAKACGKTQREVLNELVESAYSQKSQQGIQLSSSFPSQNASFANIPLEEPSSLPSEDSEKEVTYKDTLTNKKESESNSEYDAESVGSSTYDNEEAPTETDTPKQKSKSFEPIFPEGSFGKKSEDTADTNTENYTRVWLNT